ncbi:MAG: MBL fold metallo-hydrolase [Candidatus Woesearchaeota archaeon]
MAKKIKIYAVGGYNYVGKNMTIVDFLDHAIVIDAGLNMDQYTKLTEQIETEEEITEKMLISYDIIPDLRSYKDITKRVDIIIITHAHLDHVGALPYLLHHFKNPIILCTPYTAEILRRLILEINSNIKPNIKTLFPNSKIKINNTQIDFIYITHSIPQTIVVRIQRDDFVLFYANDFKLDHNPILGGKVNYEALVDQRPDVLILDSTRIELLGKTPSESVVEGMLREILLLPNLASKGIIMTTFASHIARLKTMEKVGKKFNRTVMFLGRSFKNYIHAAEKADIAKFESEIVSYKGKIKRTLKKVMKDDASKYLLIVTGHQGEKGSVLREIVTGNIKFDLRNFAVVFSCSKIPTPTSMANREFLEQKLQEIKVPIFTDVHVSGHASREDLRSFIEIIKPKLVIPAHGDLEKRSKLALLCKEINVPYVLLSDNDSMLIEKP